MVKSKWLLVLVAAAAVGAGAADTRIYEPPAWAASPQGDADPTELKWDNGSRKYLVVWYTGQNHWAGNDFAAPTTLTTVRITKLRVYTSSRWPNEKWDGMYAALYAFTAGSGGNPGAVGSMIWPTGEDPSPHYFKPGVTFPNGEGWVDVPVNWSAPAHTYTFLAAFEQRFNDPNCDPFAVDTNRTFRRHSYEYAAGGRWGFLEPSSDPYRNLMLRAVVKEGTCQPAVTPASLGRVKAVYY